jgi:hypothetical protein
VKLDVSPGLLYTRQIKFKYLPDGWQEGRGQFLLGQFVPVEVLIPSVVLDVIGSILELTVSLSNVSHEQMLH